MNFLIPRAKLSAFLITLSLVIGVSSVTGTAAIRIGSLVDVTGGTSDTGRDYAFGIGEAIHYINDKGGINGKKIKLYQFDCGYRIPEILAKYKLLKRLKVVAILGWESNDTDALSSIITQDKMPYLSAFHAAHLTNPGKTPFNLFAATDYSTNARAAITVWFDKNWSKHPDFGKRKPRFVASYEFDHPYCSGPIRAIKDQAKILGFEIGPDQHVDLSAIDNKIQVLAMRDFKADLVWHGNTTLSVSATLRDAYALELDANHIASSWGFDENLPRLAGKAAEGVMGVTTNAFFGDNIPMMDTVVEFAEKYSPGVPLEKRLIWSIRAWANVLALWEAMKRADRAGDLTGPGILKKGFETFSGYDIGLKVPPLTYTATDHRIAGKVTIYEIKDAKFQVLEVVDLKNRWPDKWAKEWLGW